MARETGGPAPHKGCNSSSCCSPAKLWRTIQTLIKENDRKGLIEFFKDSRLEHIVRVALTSRISNDASMFPPSQQHKLVKIHDNTMESNKYLGKSFTDLNSLQLALITSSESMVLTLLAQLKLHATSQELKHFVNHVYGQGNTCLHLAVFLKRYQVVKVLLDLGCKPDHLNARNKNALHCCYYGDQDMIDLLSSHKKKKSETVKTVIPMTISVPDDNTIVEKQVTIVPRDIPVIHCTKVELFNDKVNQVILKQDSVSNSHYLLRHLDTILIQQQKQKQQLFAAQYVSLAQLKKPPDIISNYYCASQPITCC